MIIVVGEPNEEDIKFAAKVTARYSKAKDEKLVKVKYGKFMSPLDNHIEVEPASEEGINEYII